MSMEKNFIYEPLESHDDDDASELLHSYEPGSDDRPPARRWSIFMIWFVIQVSNVLLFSGGYALVQVTRGQSNVAVSDGCE